MKRSCTAVWLRFHVQLYRTSMKSIVHETSRFLAKHNIPKSPPQSVLSCDSAAAFTQHPYCNRIYLLQPGSLKIQGSDTALKYDEHVLRLV